MNENGAIKLTAKLSLVAMGVLLLMAFIFYKERVYFADAPYIAFSIINYKTLSLQEHRYGSFITQIVPYIGQMLHVPMKALLISYAVSFNVFYLLVAVTLYRIRQYSLTILMTLYYLLFFSATYFWTNNEIHQAVGWMFLLFGVMLWLGHKKVKLPVLIVPFVLLAFLTIFTHFIVVIPLFFLWVFLWMEQKHWPFTKNISILLSALLVGILVSKYCITMNNSYDGSHLHGVTHFSIKDVLQTFEKPVTQVFLMNCCTNYWIAIIAGVIGIVALIRQGKRALAIWSLVCILGYIVIMGLTYGEYDKNLLLFHIESEWACIGILIGVPFVYGFLPVAKVRYAAILFVLIVITRIAYICSYAPVFSKRVHFEEQVLAKMRAEKIMKLAIINTPQLQADNIQDWGMPDESILMSAADGEKLQRTFCIISPDDTTMRKLLSTNNTVMTCWSPMGPGQWNHTYFNVDTTQPYTVMTYNELMK